MDQLVPVFLGVTGTTDEATAKQYLELTGGDLDYAVTLYMESHPPPTATGGAPGGASDADAELARKLQEEAYGDVREADASVHRHETLVDSFGFGTAPNFDRPGDIFGGGRVGVFNQRFTDEENRYYEDRFEELDDDDEYVEDDEENNVIVIDSDDDETDRPHQPMSRRARMRNERQEQLTSTQRRLANLFRPPFDLMTVANLDTAKQKGKAEKKWILVNIQDPSEFQSQVLNRDFWSNPQIKNIVKDNFIFLQYQENSPNGMHYKNFYHTTTFPHIAILDSWTGERLRTWKDGEVPDVAKWLQEVEQFLENFSLNPGSQNPIVEHETKFDPDALTEEQQIEFAIKHSLASNGDLATQNNANEQESPVEEVEEPQSEDPFESIKPVEHVEPSENFTRIQVRFPNGTRLVHKFALTDQVVNLYEWLKFVLQESPEKYGIEPSERFNLTNSSNRSFKFIESLTCTIDDANLKNASVLLEKE